MNNQHFAIFGQPRRFDLDSTEALTTETGSNLAGLSNIDSNNKPTYDLYTDEVNGDDDVRKFVSLYSRSTHT